MEPKYMVLALAGAYALTGFVIASILMVATEDGEKDTLEEQGEIFLKLMLLWPLWALMVLLVGPFCLAEQWVKFLFWMKRRREEGM